jgi:hypothetical protein
MVVAASLAVVLGLQMPGASALALRWEIVHVSDYDEGWDAPPGLYCEFGMHVQYSGSWQEMYGYDSNGVLRVLRLQNWGFFTTTITANGKTLAIPRQSVSTTYTFDEEGVLIRTANVGVDRLFVAPGVGLIYAIIGRFIVVDDEVVFFAGNGPTDRSAQAFCDYFA